MVAAALALAAPASAQAPDPASFKAIDRPNDDGTAILVTWALPDNEPAGMKYVVEVAASEADYASGNFKAVTVAATPKTLGAAKPEYFGRSAGAKRLRFAEIFPAALFPPPDKPDLSAERLAEWAGENPPAVSTDTGSLTRRLLGLLGVRPLSSAELSHAQAALANARPDNELTPAEQIDRKWFESLKNEIGSLEEEALDVRKSGVNRQTCFFRLAVLDGAAKTYVARDGRPAVVSCRAEADLFKWVKMNNLVFSLAFSSVVLAFIRVAKRRPGLFIRRIAGLDAIDEAIGRATEMDRPVFFVHGLGGLGDLPTMASISILSEVARRTAEHDTRIRVMNNDALVTAVSQEVVQQACTAAGRPDAYNADDVSLVASDQFSYVAAVSGNMVREQPGAIFMMGPFFAESLLLAETGASTGAIQVAGTDSYTQLPFFVTTCDYTLIGEELYAASAYLSRDPRLLGSLRGQDVGKAFLMITLVGVSVVVTAAALFGADFAWLRNLFEAL